MKRSLVNFLSCLLLQQQILIISTSSTNLKWTKESTAEVLAGKSQQLCPIHVTDPNWNDQWYLNGSGIIPTDFDVLHAWGQCLNGTGITIAVVDDGIFDHIDLNIDRTLDADIRPSVPATKRHGTWVAGVIAGKRNNICGTGIAFEVTLADLRIITGLREPESDSAAAAILTSSLDKIHIYSNSYINPPLQVRLYPIGKQVLGALKKGTTEGRNGKGAIYVWSTGNGGDPILPFGCAYEGLDNNPYVIPVAGIRYNYHKLASGDSCSSMMVAAFSGDSADVDRQIVTTDNIDGCNRLFGRNSAAVPMVSGAVALALQANPNLGYRDIMHLLVKSSNTNLSFEPDDFIVNGAGNKVSKTFGFGLLDIGNLVDRAKLWKNVNVLTECSFTSNVSCSLSSNRTEIVTFESCQITSLEHVEIYFNAESPRSGQLKLDLSSPNGTVSNIIPGRFFDNRLEINMTVISVHFWDESPFGKWTLMASDISGDNTRLINGTMKEWRLKFYGTSDMSFSIPSTSFASTSISTVKEGNLTAFSSSTTSKIHTTTTEGFFSTLSFTSVSKERPTTVTEGNFHSDMSFSTTSTPTNSISSKSSDSFTERHTTMTEGDLSAPSSTTTSTKGHTIKGNLSALSSSTTSTERHTAVINEVTSEKDCEDIPLPPPSAAKVEIIVPVILGVTAVILVTIIIILIIRRKSILKLASKSSCHKKIDIGESERGEKHTKNTSIYL